MGVSRMTALEIFGNQEDIVCECWGTDSNGYFVGVIRRGKGHNGKLLLSGGLNVESKEEAVQYMKSLRDDIIKWVEKELEDPESVTSRMLDSDDAKKALQVARMAKEGIE